jgi:hypothetical protein
MDNNLLKSFSFFSPLVLGNTFESTLYDTKGAVIQYFFPAFPAFLIVLLRTVKQKLKWAKRGTNRGSASVSGRTFSKF